MRSFLKQPKRVISADAVRPSSIETRLGHGTQRLSKVLRLPWVLILLLVALLTLIATSLAAGTPLFDSVTAATTAELIVMGMFTVGVLVVSPLKTEVW